MLMEISYEYCSLSLDSLFLSHRPPTESLCIVSLGYCDFNGSPGPQSSIRPCSAAQALSQKFGVSTLPVTTHPGANTPILVGHLKRSKLFKDLWGEANSLIQFHHFSEICFSWQDDSYMINLSAREKERESMWATRQARSQLLTSPFLFSDPYILNSLQTDSARKWDHLQNRDLS